MHLVRVSGLPTAQNLVRTPKERSAASGLRRRGSLFALRNV